MKKYSETISQIIDYVSKLYEQYDGLPLLYHNLRHTEKVVERTFEIAKNYDLDDTSFFVLAAAAWFHDTGHVNGGVILHERRSITLMRNFLQPKGIHEEILLKAEGCIAATKLPHFPYNFLEEILCDADTYNFGTPEFLKTDIFLKQELILRGMDTNNWEEKKLQLLLNHRYFTPYCRLHLNAGKEVNIKMISTSLKKTMEPHSK